MTNTKQNVILVFVKSRFTQRNKAYMLKTLPSNQNEDPRPDSEIWLPENENGWKTVHAPILIGIYADCTTKEVKNKLQKTFPQADPDIFLYVPTALTKEEANELCKANT